VKPDQDFLLYYTQSEKDIAVNVLTHRPAGDGGTFMVMIAPGQSGQKLVAKDVIFVQDTSGSMLDDGKIEQARKALAFCVKSLGEGDRFNIVSFATEARPFWDGLVDVNAENIEAAVSMIAKLEAVGGTNIDEALRLAVGMAEKSDRPCMVVFLTDGKPTIGETDSDRLAKGIAALGKKKRAALHLRRRSRRQRPAARPPRGREPRRAGVRRPEGGPRGEGLLLLRQDRASGPGRPRPFHRGRRDHRPLPEASAGPLPRRPADRAGALHGRGPGRPAAEGDDRRRGEGDRPRGDLREADRRERLPPAHLGHPEDRLPAEQMRLHGDSKEVRDEIVRLAKRHGVVTPYTSFLVLEDEEMLQRDAEARRRLGAEAPAPGKAVRDAFGDRPRRVPPGTPAARPGAAPRLPARPCPRLPARRRRRASAGSPAAAPWTPPER
jgi:Ca-activated chloride channel family protein